MFHCEIVTGTRSGSGGSSSLAASPGSPVSKLRLCTAGQGGGAPGLAADSAPPLESNGGAPDEGASRFTRLLSRFATLMLLEDGSSSGTLKIRSSAPPTLSSSGFWRGWRVRFGRPLVDERALAAGPDPAGAGGPADGEPDGTGGGIGPGGTGGPNIRKGGGGASGPDGGGGGGPRGGPLPPRAPLAPPREWDDGGALARGGGPVGGPIRSGADGGGGGGGGPADGAMSTSRSAGSCAAVSWEVDPQRSHFMVHPGRLRPVGARPSESRPTPPPSTGRRAPRASR